MPVLKRLAIAVFAAFAMAGCSPFYAGAETSHFDGTHFFNPPPVEQRDVLDFLRWQFTREPAQWPEAIANPVQAKPPAHVAGEELLVTMVGHATVLIQTEGLNILTDPIWSNHASPIPFFGPERHRLPGIAFDDLPKIDVILISHNHYDHMDLPTLKMLWERDHPKVIVPLGNDRILWDNIPRIESMPLDWGQSQDIGWNVRVIATPVQHWSQRTPFDLNKALWAGYLIDTPGGTIFFAGDTALGTGWWVDEVKKLAPKPIRLALLPIGAFAPRWFMSSAHEDPEEAVKTFRKLGAAAAMAIHWGTFAMADEGPERPRTELKTAREEDGVPADAFRALEPGESWDVK